MVSDIRSEVRAQLLSHELLVRAVASGRARSRSPQWRRVELRPVDLKAGPRLQVTRYSPTQAFTANHEWGSSATADVIDELLDEGFAEWTVDTVSSRTRMRWSASGTWTGTARPRESVAAPSTAHDRPKERLLPLSHPVLHAIGVTTADGQVKSSRHDKVRQVDEFLRLLDSSLRDSGIAEDSASVRLLDLGCGNAYLTFAAHALLTAQGHEAQVVGVDVKQQALDRNTEIAQTLGVSDQVRFVRSTIVDAPHEVDGHQPDVVMALHACDTASDDAIAAGVRSGARLLMVAPCCHHDLQRQLAATPPPQPFEAITRDGILRERWADVLTDGLRADVLRLLGYRVDVVEFVATQHTPRNVMIRAVRADHPAEASRWAEYQQLTEMWSVHPRLAELLAAELAARFGATDPSSTGSAT